MTHMADPFGCPLLLCCRCSQHVALLQMGPPQRSGLQASAEHVFDFSKKHAPAACVAVQASMLEIYNEEYKDLLGKGPPTGKKHQVTVAALQVQADKHGLTWGPAMTGGRHGGSCTAEVLSCLRVSLRAASVPQAMLHFDKGCPDPWLCVAAAFMHHDNAWGRQWAC